MTVCLGSLVVMTRPSDDSLARRCSSGSTVSNTQSPDLPNVLRTWKHPLGVVHTHWKFITAIKIHIRGGNGLRTGSFAGKEKKTASSWTSWAQHRLLPSQETSSPSAYMPISTATTTVTKHARLIVDHSEDLEPSRSQCPDMLNSKPTRRWQCFNRWTKHRRLSFVELEGNLRV